MLKIKSERDIRTATSILVESYRNTKNISWMFKQTDENLWMFFDMLVHEAVLKEGAYMTENKLGIFFLHPVKSKGFSLKVLYKKLCVVLFVLGIKNSYKAIKLNKIKTKPRTNDGYYVSALGISKGIHARTVVQLRNGFNHLKNSINKVIYVETINARMFPLYEKLGFKEYKTIQHPYIDDKLYFMKTSNENYD